MKTTFTAPTGTPTEREIRGALFHVYRARNELNEAEAAFTSQVIEAVRNGTLNPRCVTVNERQVRRDLHIMPGETDG